MLEITGTVSKRDMKEQLLDGMDLERERGITIKLQPVRMKWRMPPHKLQTDSECILNLIDTPGHVDFQFEVSRSLAACEGAILVVDATQGMEAQTLANLYLALEHDLTIIPVLNKIDLPAAEPKKIALEVADILGCEPESILKISGKTGEGVPALLDKIITDIPSPKSLPGGSPADYPAPEAGETKALIFDSVFDTYRGVVIYVRLFSGAFKRGIKARLIATGQVMDILEVGHFKPEYDKQDEIVSGEVAYVVTGLKSTKEARVGDTLYFKEGGNPDARQLPGFKIVKPLVYAGVFPVDADDYPQFRDALEKLSLSDSALTFEPENSPALGNGFRIGLLGMLHLEIIQSRLEREFNLDLITTAPSVSYYITLNNNERMEITSAASLPEAQLYQFIEEPWSRVEIITPEDRIGGIMDLCTSRRGRMKNMQHTGKDRVIITFEMPLQNVITDLHDKLKSVSSGYASMSSELLDYREEDLVRLNIILAGDVIDSLSQMAHRSEARKIGAPICEKLKEVIPRANFPIAIQAAIGGQVVARETISAYRKDVTAKLYGGDVSRKNKLLKKQKAGKKRMKAIGKVNLPQEAFMAILKRD